MDEDQPVGERRQRKRRYGRDQDGRREDTARPRGTRCSRPWRQFPTQGYTRLAGGRRLRLLTGFETTGPAARHVPSTSYEPRELEREGTRLENRALKREVESRRDPVVQVDDHNAVLGVVGQESRRGLLHKISEGLIGDRDGRERLRPIQGKARKPSFGGAAKVSPSPTAGRRSGGPPASPRARRASPEAQLLEVGDAVDEAAHDGVVSVRSSKVRARPLHRAQSPARRAARGCPAPQECPARTPSSAISSTSR